MAIPSTIHTHGRQFHQPPGNNIGQKTTLQNGGNNTSHKATTSAKISKTKNSGNNISHMAITSANQKPWQQHQPFWQ